MLKCDICGEERFKHQGSLDGHKRMVHKTVDAQDTTVQMRSQAQSTSADLRMEERMKALEAQVATMAQVVHDTVLPALPADTAEPEALMAQLEPALYAWLRQQGAHPGICHEATCNPCRTAEAAMRQSILTDLQRGCEWAGETGASERVAASYEEWATAGRPEGRRERAAPSDMITLVP